MPVNRGPRHRPLASGRAAHLREHRPLGRSYTTAV